MSNSSKMPHGFARLIIGDGSAVSEQKNIIWNMIGSFLYAFASMVLSIAVVQLAGEDAGGVFTFAFTTFGQHMFMAAYFGIRPFQITDTGEKYTFGDYLGLRLITCGLAILVGFSYVMVSGYTFEKAAIVFLMVVYKVIDALADTYEAEFQRGGRLYLTGKSNAFRTILSVACFLGSLALTGELLTASIWAVGAQIAGFLLFDVLVIRELPNVTWKSGRGKKFQLFRDNILLFFSVVLDFYIFSASKYAIEAHMADRDLAVYGAIFMPTSVINLVAGFVIRPYLTKLAVDWETGHLKAFRKIIRNLALIIAALTVLAVGGAWHSGDQPAVPEPAGGAFHLPCGTGTHHPRRSTECVHEPVLLFAHNYAETEVHHSWICFRQCAGGPFLRLVCPDGRDSGRFLCIHAFDGRTDGIFRNLFGRLYETERESTKT